MRTSEEQRYVFARDLIESGILDKKTRDEVEALLGPPSSSSEIDNSIAYVVKAEGSGFDQVFVVEIQFDPKTATATVARIRGD